MASVNKSIILGNVGKDPELRHTSNGVAVCSVGIATNRTWKDKATGEKREETEWHRVVFYDRLAEVAGEYLKAGSSVYVEGYAKTRKWTDKEGIERYTTEIIGNEMKLLGSRAEREADETPTSKPAPARSAPPSRPPARPSAAGFSAMDDDGIPF